MPDTTWEEVGRRFTDLGHELQQAWQAGQPDEGAKRDLQDAGDRVTAALNDLAHAIDCVADAPEVRDATKKATSGVADALASTLQDVAAWLDRPRGSGESSTPDDDR